MGELMFGRVAKVNGLRKAGGTGMNRTLLLPGLLPHLTEQLVQSIWPIVIKLS